MHLHAWWVGAPCPDVGCGQGGLRVPMSMDWAGSYERLLCLGLVPKACAVMGSGCWELGTTSPLHSSSCWLGM